MGFRSGGNNQGNTSSSRARNNQKIELVAMEREFLISERGRLNSEDDEEETDIPIPHVREEMRVKPFTPLSVPRDRCSYVYLIFLLMGLITVVPWNFFMTAEGYWMYKFRDTNGTHEGDPEYKSELQTMFGSYLSIASMAPAMLFLFVNTLISSKISPKFRLVSSLLGMLLMFATAMAFTKIDTDKWQWTFFGITMGTVVLINSCSSMFQGALLGLASSFPSRYMQAAMNGQAVAGVFANIASVGALALKLRNEDTSFIYFLVACFMIFLSLMAYFSMTRTVYYLYYVQQVKDAEERAELDVLLHGQGQNSLCYVFRKILKDGFTVFMTYFGTLSVFPAVAQLVVSTNFHNGAEISNQYFIPVGCFLIVNISDLTGRVVSGVVRLPSQKSMVLPVLSILRVAAIPMLMMCNAQPRNHLPVIFNSDMSFVFICLFLGFTNGYLINLGAIYAPRQVEVEYREVAGAMIAFFMGAGLTAGALLSNVFVRIL